MGDVNGMVKIFTQSPLRRLLHCMKYSSTKERFAFLDCFQNIFLHWMKIFMNNLGLGVFEGEKVNCCAPVLIIPITPITHNLNIVFLGEKTTSVSIFLSPTLFFNWIHLRALPPALVRVLHGLVWHGSKLCVRSSF